MSRYACCKHCEHDVTAYRDGHDEPCNPDEDHMRFVLAEYPWRLGFVACGFVPFEEA